MTKQNFVLRLKQLRESRELSQVKASEKVGINIKQYELYESIAKPTVPNYKNLIKLSEFFNCSIDYLLCQTDNPKHFR